MASFIGSIYSNHDGQIFWYGVGMTEGDDFNRFLTKNVASRLYDEEGQSEFETHLRSLGDSGFVQGNLDGLVSSSTEEIGTGWRVGEAIAEAFLAQEYSIVWPWNMNRDRRNPKASLPGADLVGFKVDGSNVQFAFGEVKTSSDSDSPPGVMKGYKGMTNQLKNLSEASSLVWEIIRWLYWRCKREPYQGFFNSAIKLFAETEKTAFSLYGVLIRDTPSDERDLSQSGRTLAGILSYPTICHLFAIYIPCAVDDLPHRIIGSKQ